MKTLLLDKEDVGGLISMKEVIGAVEEAFVAFSSGQVEQPDYIGIHLPPPRGEIDFKLGYYQANEMISMKASSGGFPDNPAAYGLPTNMGTILLFDGRTCALTCVMDGSLITGLRTGAAGAVSATGAIAYRPGDESLVGSEPVINFTVQGPIGEARRSFDSGPLAQFLTQRALEKEQQRVEAMQAALLEKQRLRREVRYYAALQDARDQAEEHRRLEEMRVKAEQDARERARQAAEAQARADAEAAAKAAAEAKARADAAAA